ncbi:MAG: tetratricopeptide repeat protein [Saprospiraceae bacterium]|nr:tetratricopeptide repeat protein [Saprospiraceae bacterium]
MASPKKNKKNKKKSARQNKQPTTTPKKNKSNSINKPVNKSGKKNNLIFLAISCFILAAITFYVYQGALDNDFVDWDDYAYVIDNNLVRADSDIKTITSIKNNNINPINATTGNYNTTIGDVFQRIVSLNYHPLTVLTMRWNNNVCLECSNGISAHPFIFWNIILHILNSILVLLLIFWMTKRNILSAIVVASVFALHPMHVESVAWVSERKDVLYTFFFLGGLLTYCKYLSTSHKKWLLMTFILMALSCLSKAMAVVFPVVMILIYFWNEQSKNNFSALKNTVKISSLVHTIPFFGVALFFGLIAVNVQSGGDFGGMLVKSSSSVAINSFDTFSIIQRFQFACYGFIEYLIRFFLPTELCTFYPYPDQPTYDNSMYFKLAPFIVLTILGLTIASIKYTKSIAVGIGFYMVTIVLVLQFISVGAVLMADRYTYIPYIGFTFIFVMLVQEFIKKNLQVPSYLCMIALCLTLIPKTIDQIETWQDSETLWTNVIDLHKVNGNLLQQNMEQPLSIRGNYYGKKSEKSKTNEERIKYINMAFEDFTMAAQLGSKRPDVYEGIGNTYGMKGHNFQSQGQKEKAYDFFQKAIENYNKALTLNPQKGSAYFNRAVTYSILRNHTKAIEDYTNAMKYAPEQSPSALVNRGISYKQIGQKNKAIADFQKALQYNPDHKLARDFLIELTRN